VNAPLTLRNDAQDWDEISENGVLRQFWQPSFLDSYLWNWQLSPVGHVFYPKRCFDGVTQCKLHIHLHGCTGSLRFGGSVWESPLAYFIPFAVENDLIVVFPDLHGSLFNPAGCWDSFGFTGSDYNTNYSDTGNFLMRVIDRVTSPVDTDKYGYEFGNLFPDKTIPEAIHSFFTFIFNRVYNVKMFLIAVLRFLPGILGLTENWVTAHDEL
jgi:hypothetical protein